jgi:hypothetical protein
MPLISSLINIIQKKLTYNFLNGAGNSYGYASSGYGSSYGGAYGGAYSSGYGSHGYGYGGMKLWLGEKSRDSFIIRF